MYISQLQQMPQENASSMHDIWGRLVDLFPNFSKTYARGQCQMTQLTFCDLKMYIHIKFWIP